MNTTDKTQLNINVLTQEQYEQAKADEELDADSLYMVAEPSVYDVYLGPIKEAVSRLESSKADTTYVDNAIATAIGDAIGGEY